MKEEKSNTMVKMVVAMSVICLLSGGFFGFLAGQHQAEESSNEGVYARYLTEILPENENEFTYIVLRENGYHVCHNTTWDFIVNLKENSSYWTNIAICSNFNGKTIWHEPGFAIIPIIYHSYQLFKNVINGARPNGN